MTRDDGQRLEDIVAAIAAVREHAARGDLSDGLVFDAVRMRLIEIGEAVKALSDELLASEPSTPWEHVAGMRNHLAHRYFDTTHSIVAGTVANDLPELLAAVTRLQDRLRPST